METQMFINPKQLSLKAIKVVLCLILILSVNASRGEDPADLQEAEDKRSFTINPKTWTFMKDGTPFQYISGSMHYFRTPKAYWLDRLEKAKAAGLDAIETYVAWNYHEWEEGVYNFADDRDIELFIELIAQVDLLAIVRVGPYICAEWSFGGLPPWLLRKNPLVRIRSSDPDYYTYVAKWFDVLLPKLRPLLYSNGGPIIMVQLENEYGSSAICDKEYMSMLYDMARYHLGQEIILFTTDGDSENLLRCGSPDSRYLATIDFGPTNSTPKEAFSSVEHYRPNQPLVNSEFYTGWFDQWGVKRKRKSIQPIVSSLQKLMLYSTRVNVNLYMFHGGTTFGFWSGDPQTGPVITSYDYDAPLSEAGDITDLYIALRDIIHRLKNIDPPALPKNSTKGYFGPVSMKLTNHMMANLAIDTQTEYPTNMEAFRQYEGFLVYSTDLPAVTNERIKLVFERFADIAQVYTSDEQLVDLHWHTAIRGPSAEVVLTIDSKIPHTKLLLLVENTGYKNYGPAMWNDVKGIIRNVTHENTPLSPWAIMYVQDIPGSLRSIVVQPSWPNQGAIYTGQLLIPRKADTHDTFIQPDGFSRGVIFVNGYNLGRFNQNLGPQLRLYLPKPFLRQGINQIVVIELESVHPELAAITFHTEPLTK